MAVTKHFAFNEWSRKFVIEFKGEEGRKEVCILLYRIASGLFLRGKLIMNWPNPAFQRICTTAVFNNYFPCLPLHMVVMELIITINSWLNY